MLTVRRIRDITNPCFERETIAAEWRPGATVRDFLPADLNERHVLVQLNGGPVPLAAHVADGSELVFAEWPGTIEAILLNLLISAVLSFAAMKLAPKPELPKASRRGRTINNFAGLQSAPASPAEKSRSSWTGTPLVAESWPESGWRKGSKE